MNEENVIAVLPSNKTIKASLLHWKCWNRDHATIDDILAQLGTVDRTTSFAAQSTTSFISDFYSQLLYRYATTASWDHLRSSAYGNSASSEEVARFLLEVCVAADLLRFDDDSRVYCNCSRASSEDWHMNERLLGAESPIISSDKQFDKFIRCDEFQKQGYSLDSTEPLDLVQERRLKIMHKILGENYTPTKNMGNFTMLKTVFRHFNLKLKRAAGTKLYLDLSSFAAFLSLSYIWYHQDAQFGFLGSIMCDQLRLAVSVHILGARIRGAKIPETRFIRPDSILERVSKDRLDGEVLQILSREFSYQGKNRWVKFNAERNGRILGPETDRIVQETANFLDRLSSQWRQDRHYLVLARVKGLIDGGPDDDSIALDAIRSDLCILEYRFYQENSSRLYSVDLIQGTERWPEVDLFRYPKPSVDYSESSKTPKSVLDRLHALNRFPQEAAFLADCFARVHSALETAILAYNSPIDS